MISLIIRILLERSRFEVSHGSPMRLYDATRNMIYLNKKYPQEISLG